MTLTLQGLSSEFRLKQRRHFLRLSRGRYFSTNSLIIQWGRSGLPHARIGVTIVRRMGSAVERNLFRRRAKEAFRRSSIRNCPGIDINIKPKNGVAVPYSEFFAAFEQLEKVAKLNPKASTGVDA